MADTTTDPEIPVYHVEVPEGQKQFFFYVKVVPGTTIVPPAPPALQPLKNGDLGVDVSHYQPAIIDWAKPVAAGYRFVYVKSSEGTYAFDSFGPQYNPAKGIIRRAPYHFYRPDIAVTPVQQARFWANVLKDQTWDEVPMVDIEDPYTGTKMVARDAYRDGYVEKLKAFLEECDQRLGYMVGIYTRKSYLSDLIPAGKFPQLAARRLWVAAYPIRWPNPAFKPAIPEPWTRPFIWQFDNAQMSWSKPVPGIGPCDQNIWMGE